jgi:hypothetical protein
VINIIKILDAELNAICFLMALLGAHPILHVSRIRVNTSVILQKKIYYRRPVDQKKLKNFPTSFITQYRRIKYI